MKRIWRGWNVMRLLRLVLAVVILVQGIVASEAITVIIGIVFGGMALANIGCCSGGSCAANERSINRKSKDTKKYEEVVVNE